MSKRISHSLLDPFIMPHIPRLYRAMRIPRWYPPEGIIAIGHLLAAAGGFGFALSTTRWWGGLLGAAGVMGNHLADMVDGTHARRTGQCRHGGELLDHFTDPLSFCYWLIGMGISVMMALDRPVVGLGMALATVVLLYATAVLTNIKAKMVGDFTLAAFGPTEFKVLMMLYGAGLSVALVSGADATQIGVAAAGWLALLILVGIVQLVANLIGAVREVNRSDAAPDTADWIMRTDPDGGPTGKNADSTNTGSA